MDTGRLFTASLLGRKSKDRVDRETRAYRIATIIMQSDIKSTNPNEVTCLLVVRRLGVVIKRGKATRGSVG